MVRILVGINLIEFFVVVALSVNEGKQQAPRLWAKNLFEDASFQVVLDSVTRRILAVLQEAGVTTAGSRGACFLDFVVGRVGKTQHQPLELFAEFVFFGQVFQTLALGFRRRVEHEAAFTDKNRPGHFAVYGRDKTDCARN